jgi:hypothetical protein
LLKWRRKRRQSRTMVNGRSHQRYEKRGVSPNLAPRAHRSEWCSFLRPLHLLYKPPDHSWIQLFSTLRTVVYEASYLPFLFPSTPDEEQPAEATFKGRRVFGEYGKEMTDKVLYCCSCCHKGGCFEQNFRQCSANINLDSNDTKERQCRNQGRWILEASHI